jgi:hypothetical protein
VVSSSTLLRSVCEVGSAAALVDGHYFSSSHIPSNMCATCVYPTY